MTGALVAGFRGQQRSITSDLDNDDRRAAQQIEIAHRFDDRAFGVDGAIAKASASAS